MDSVMREYSEAWQRVMLRHADTGSGRAWERYAWAESAVTVIFALGWMAAILSGRL